MKTLLRIVFVLLGLGLATMRAADDKLVAAVKAADDERIAAMMAPERARLDAIFSNDLHYGHSSAKNDNKASYLESLVTKSTVYDGYEHITREFRQVAPGVVAMIGRARVKSHTATSVSDNDLNYFALWREEGGKWRFLAWQSTRNPPPVAPAAGAPQKK